MSLHPRFSLSKNFSRDGFKPIPADGDGGIMSSNDATIDIPLEQIPTNTSGYRQASSTALKETNTNTSQPQQRRWHVRGRRQKSDPYGRKKGNTGYDGEEDTVNAMGKVYKRITHFSALVRTTRSGRL